MTVSKQIEKFLQKTSISLLHKWQVFQYARSPLRKKTPLLIYQMGKVGSSTIRKSINALNMDIQSYHLHYMSGIDYMISLCRQQSLPLQDHILASIYCKQLLKKARADDTKLNVISLVREPIAKNISQFFQNIKVSYPEFKYSEKERRLSQDELVAEMIDFFIHNFRHDDPLVWFDVELKQFTNVDVFRQSFPHKQGFQIYANDRFRVLVIRLESLNSCISSAMEQFLGFKEFKLINDNVSSKKEYADLYQKVKQKIKLPMTYIDKMYSSKMATHLYTSKELDNFRRKWARNEDIRNYTRL